MLFSSETILRTTPGTRGGRDIGPLARCIDECFACAQACTSCADACLGEADVDMLRRCIRLNLDCADVCVATGRVLSRISQGPNQTLTGVLLSACASACADCASKSQKHASAHEHCGISAEACRRCETACRALISS